MEAAAEAAEGESSFSSTISDNSSLSESHSNSKTRRLTSSVTSHDSHLRSRPLSLPAQSFNNLQTETTQNNSVRAASFSYRGSVCKPNFQIRSYSSVVFSVQSKRIEFILPDQNSLIIENCSGNWTVGQVKDKVWKLLESAGLLESLQNHTLTNYRDEYVLKYHLKGDVYELFDNLQLMQTLKIYPLWLEDNSTPGQLFIAKKQQKTDEDKHCDLTIGYIMDMDLRNIFLTSDPELAWTRRILVSVCEEAVKTRDLMQYAMEPDTLSIAPPSHVCKKCPDNEIEIELYFGKEALDLSKISQKFNITTKADSIVQEAFSYYQEQGLASGLIDEWTLKLCGYEDYVWGDHEILTFRRIQWLLIKDITICITLVRKPDLSANRLPNMTKMDMVDNNSYLGGLHEHLTATQKKPEDVFIMSMWDITHNFRIKVIGINGLEMPSTEGCDHDVIVGNVFVEAALYHGGVPLTTCLSSIEYPFKPNIYFHQWLRSDIQVKNIPKTARLCLVVKAHIQGCSNPVPVYRANLQLLDHRGVLRRGLINLPLWPVTELANLINLKKVTVDSGMQPSGPVTPNPSSKAPILYIQLHSYAHPVVCPHSGNPCGGDSSALRNPTKNQPPKGTPMEQMLMDIVQSDALTMLDDTQRDLVETYRHYLCKKYPDALPKYLLSVKWSDLHNVLEAQKLLEEWKQPISLELLDYHFADENVRCCAVKRLQQLHNDELQLYLLQLVQVLKFEPYNDNPLVRFLLTRALQSKKIGYRFFWFLASEMSTPEYQCRFGVILEAYLRYCGVGMLEELYKQRQAIKAFNLVALRLKKFLEPKGCNRMVGSEYVRNELFSALKKRDLPSSFLLHYNSSIRVGKLNIRACKHMNSKKKPLWLEFENMDPSAKSSAPIGIIFKHGDDLRQDMLALQTLMLMERLWHEKGLNLYLVPYGCVATGCQAGVIEVVPHAETIARIQLKADEEKTLLERCLRNSTLKEDTITEWLKGSASWRTVSQQQIVDKFVLSCAGYCIATYVLGIGDRHSDNIMLKSDGNLFHIDFGHFLGNKKYFRVAGQKIIKRERVPFVLTPDFVHVMGGKDGIAFRKFRQTCSEAYAHLRSQTHLFINLFHMMIPSGMKELSRAEDIEYLRNALCAGQCDLMAEEHIRSQINRCVQDGWKTTVDWWFHYWSARK
ncbi:phosphatidylinositol 4,5-bisphosphate 3-kinase catalytic subunit gamma isoform-like isoform X2 [Corticium candelabrum]|uniref:phosphatidylinositol 4,5-bisphosphate 3-kinase catalytic subunit gamma isoform-like isoform X2 n=1 Tax=Corticium candelabrum TaxID=121492 RepID=UPI002E26AEB6|nr:phosphatidylinositol 4,5-bisphosphate 3-kinase catalytic subunit gamma isoform-like isoform X2 [Corticium candelabrum]